VAALHTRGRCFINLSRAEGWSLGAFDAGAYGNAVVTTAWGGHLEYLDAGTAWLVDFELVPAEDPAPGSLYTADQLWAEPSVSHGAELLRRVFEDSAEAAVRADRLRRRVEERYGPPAVAAAFLRAVGSQRRSA
jgi:glycosyltransferase involved in cell wall biosynthesis